MSTNSSLSGPTKDDRAEAIPGVFVIWPTARHLQAEILADLDRRFCICSVHEIRWTPKLVTANFQRFYSDLELRGVYHRLNKGDGPFLAIRLIVDKPEFDVRMTGRGRRRVIADLMDAKSLYREWSGGIGIHCGETRWETDRDLCMLLGPEAAEPARFANVEWDGSIVPLHRDLTGSRSWSSFDELFGVLNRATTYVAIDYDDSVGENSEIDLLTDNYYALHTLLSSGRFMRARPPCGGRLPIRVGSRRIRVGIRFPGDNYIDAAWARRLLQSRTLHESGFFRPADGERFWALAFHALMRKDAVDEHARQRLFSLACDEDLRDWGLILLQDETRARMELLKKLSDRHIECPVPLDRQARTGHGVGTIRSPLSLAADRLLGVTVPIAQRFVDGIRTAYWPIRDGILLKAPWLSKVKHWRRQLS